MVARIRIVEDAIYEDLASEYQCEEISRLDEILRSHGLDQKLRRRICEEYCFSMGSSLDSSDIDHGDKTFYPQIHFVQRRDDDMSIKAIYVTSQFFSFHEYALGAVEAVFDGHWRVATDAPR